jgi:hypothetical protein
LTHAIESGTFASHGFYFDLTVRRCLDVLSATAWVDQQFQEGRFQLLLQDAATSAPGTAFLTNFKNREENYG